MRFLKLSKPGKRNKDTKKNDNDREGEHHYFSDVKLLHW